MPLGSINASLGDLETVIKGKMENAGLNSSLSHQHKSGIIPLTDALNYHFNNSKLQDFTEIKSMSFKQKNYANRFTS